MKKWDYLEESSSNESENSKIKDFLTKSLPKKVAAIGISTAIVLSALTFGGCQNQNANNNQGGNSSIEQSENQKPNDSDIIKNPIIEVPGGQTNPGGTTPGGTTDENKIPVDEVASVVEKLRNNFSCVMNVGFDSTTYEVTDGVVKIQEYEKPAIIYQSDETGNYVYTHKGDYNWEKNFAQTQYNPDPILYDQMCKIEWTAYDADKKLFTGKLDGKEMLLKMQDDTSFNLSCDAWNADVYRIGTTEIALPEIFVDKTVPEKYVSTIDLKGNVDYDYVLLKEVMEDWMKGNNQWDKDVLAQKSSKEDYKTQEIIFVRPSSEKLEFGLVMNRGEEAFYYRCYFEDAKLLSMFESSDVKEEKFVEYLNSIQPKILKLNAEQPQIDTTISQQDFEKMTANVFKKLTNKGVQNGGVNVDAPATKLPNFDKAEIIYGFKACPTGGENADATLGYKKGWKQYYIVEYNGKVELISMEVVSSTYNSVKDENQNVINDTDGWWYVHSVSREELDKENVDLFEMSESEVVSTNEKEGEKVQGKNKELR